MNLGSLLGALLFPRAGSLLLLCVPAVFVLLKPACMASLLAFLLTTESWLCVHPHHSHHPRASAPPGQQSLEEYPGAPRVKARRLGLWSFRTAGVPFLPSGWCPKVCSTWSHQTALLQGCVEVGREQGAGAVPVSTVCEATLSQTASISHISFHSYSPWLPFLVLPAVGSKGEGTSEKSEALVTWDSWPVLYQPS